MISRRFLNLVANTYTRGHRPAYKLHLIDTSSFFQPRSGDDEMEDFRLPPAAMTFYGASSEDDPGMDFMPFGRGSQKSILTVDRKCRVTLYDAASAAVSTMPSLHAAKVTPISLPVGDSVYVMNSSPGSRHCFEALIRGHGPNSRYELDWYWHSLPPPPHVRGPSYVPYDSDIDDDDDYNNDYDQDDVGGPHTMVPGASIIDGHTVVGDSHIWISTRGAGTYSFDMASGVWSQAVDWALPFSGRAEYVPELNNLWFGFSSQDNRLCAVDLTVTPPVLRDVWDDVAQPQEWSPVTSYLVPLGSGKLFLAKFFETKEKRHLKNGDWIYGKCDNFAVFAGVELLEKPGGGLRMVKHSSKRSSSTSSSYQHYHTTPAPPSTPVKSTPIHPPPSPLGIEAALARLRPSGDAFA